MLLLLALACSKPAPPADPGFTACVAACEERGAMRAVAADVLRSGCEEECGPATVVRTGGELEARTGRVRVVGAYQRIAEPPGTALVLEDGTRVWISEGTAAPHGWEALLGQRLEATGELATGPHPGAWLTDLDGPVPAP